MAGATFPCSDGAVTTLFLYDVCSPGFQEHLCDPQGD